MKRKLTHNLGTKILSVLIAFLVWIVIVNIEDPVTSRTFHVTVDILNENALESVGKVYRVIEGSEVDVTVTGNKSFIDSLKTSDIRATADLSKLYFTNSTPIEAECTKYTTNKPTVTLGRVKSLVVELEDLAEERFPVRFNVVGQAMEGYYVSTTLMKSSPGMITVSDGESIINRIDQVAVEVNVNKRTEDFELTLEPKAYNSDGDLIELDESSFSVQEVTVTVQVLQTKTVPINVKVVGEPASGYELIGSNIIYEPNQIVIAGLQEALDACNSIDLEVDITGAKETIDTVIELNQDILPSDIILADNNSSVAIEVEVAKLQTKDFTVKLEDINIILPSSISDYRFENEEQVLNVRVTASATIINDITITSLQPMIDLSERSYGEHDVKVSFNPVYDITVTGGNSVTIELMYPEEVETSAEPTVEPSSSPSTSPSSTPSEEPEDTTSPSSTPIVSETDEPEDEEE